MTNRGGYSRRVLARLYSTCCDHAVLFMYLFSAPEEATKINLIYRFWVPKVPILFASFLP